MSNRKLKYTCCVIVGLLLFVAVSQAANDRPRFFVGFDYISSGNIEDSLRTTETILLAEPGNDRALYLKSLALLSLAPAELASTANSIPASSPLFEKVAPLKELAKLLLPKPREWEGTPQDSHSGDAAQYLAQPASTDEGPPHFEGKRFSAFGLNDMDLHVGTQNLRTRRRVC